MRVTESVAELSQVGNESAVFETRQGPQFLSRTDAKQMNVTRWRDNLRGALGSRFCSIL